MNSTRERGLSPDSARSGQDVPTSSLADHGRVTSNVEPSAQVERVRFVSRETCPTCGQAGYSVVWSGRFNDPEIRRYMEKFHYSGEWQAALADADFSLVGCSACGMLWHCKVIAPEWVPIVYGEWADAEQASRFEAAHVVKGFDPRESGVQRIKLVLRILHLLDPTLRQPALLDFGCGGGALLRTAEGLGMSVRGIDVSASRSMAVREAGFPVWPDLEAYDVDMDADADAVVLSQVLEHVADPLGLLQALHARMSPDGVLFVAVPDCTGITVPRDFGSFHKVAPVEHMNAFIPATLTEICRRAGFVPIERPTAVVTTNLRGALRSSVNWLWRPRSTDQFFRRVAG